MFDLLTAFKSVLDNMPKEVSHEVVEEGVTVEEQIEFLEQRLEENEQLSFTDMMSRLKTKLRVVTTFMAILEMIRTHRIQIRQASTFGDIWVIKHSS